jgi:predicted porin
MKKHLIAAAVAGALAVPAMAQVTVSGTLDVRAYQSGDITVGTGATAVKSDSKGSGGESTVAVDGFSTSQIVFTAEEDLGGGLKAKAVFAQRLENTLGARDRSIELSGGFGSIRLGRFNPAISANYLSISGLGSTGNAGTFYNLVTSGVFATGAPYNALSASGEAYGEGSFERQDNIIQYTSPSIGGISASIGVVNTSSGSNQEAGDNSNEQMHVTVAYTAGPLALAAGYGNRKNEVLASDSDSTTLEKWEGDLTWFGGSYDLGAAKLHLTHLLRDNKVSSDNVSIGKLHDAKVTTIAASVPLGAITLRASYYDGEDELVNATAGIDAAAEMDGYQISGTYAFSKRTFAYLIYGENNLDYKLAANSDANTKVKQTGLGVVHNF